jgi:hypothetical protein
MKGQDAHCKGDKQCAQLNPRLIGHITQKSAKLQRPAHVISHKTKKSGYAPKKDEPPHPHTPIIPVSLASLCVRLDAGRMKRPRIMLDRILSLPSRQHLIKG